ncbi:MAG: bacillithiol biosynthesis cysteine-adding enzyme BshC [Blastocatellales bacterium]|nr:bacillithiol biosynthesis cysteine-adding enzyme BshC [Blastocatellales bacterium]
MSESAISFRDIPRTSRLFLDFLYDRERVAGFYHGRNGRPMAERIAEVTAGSFARDEVADILLRQNRAAGAGPETLANIERLRAPDSVVVITGQQAGLFTGPLFTIYKAISAIRLAERLRDEGANAVPMFWIASEDHDFAEVNHCRVVNREGQLTTITYTACTPKEGKPVGHVTLCDEIEQNISDLLAALPESEFVPQLAGDLRAAYQPGTSFAEAFGRMVLKLTGKYGIVMINPLDERLKHMAGKIYAEAMERAPEFAARLVEKSRAIEAAGYHAQVHTSPEAVPLFLIDEGRRTALTRGEDNTFHLKGSDKSFTHAELLESVKLHPAGFSPNVTLRPIVQDYLLPTALYIGGPAEIAYFAQLRAGYELLGRLHPLVEARASLTLIEKRHAKTLQKHGLKFEDLFEGIEAVFAKVVERSLDAGTAAVFDETERTVEEQMERLRASLVAVDPTLADALKGGREKILYQLNNLRTRFVHNRTKRDETTRTQIERLFPVLYPNRNLQEREINASYFLARYGYGLIDRLYEEIDPTAPDHRLLYI